MKGNPTPNNVGYPKVLVESIAALSSLILSEGDVESTVQRIVDLAVHAIDGAENCSVSLARAGAITTIATTSDVGREIDELQYETKEGPCLSSIKEHQTFYIPDMRRDEIWPAFSKRAAEATGIKSMLSFVLELHRGVQGALNLTSTKRDGFDEEDITTGAVFAVTASVALENALEHAEKAEQIGQLEEALVTRRIIGQATGLLMGHEGLSADDAFEQLVRVSQNANIKLREIARRYVQTWENKAKP